MAKYPEKYNIERREIQLIHIAKQQLGMDEDTYRAMLHAVAGVRSSVELGAAGRTKVLAHLKTCGFKVQGRQAGQTHQTLASDKHALERKIGALLGQLDAQWPYAYAVARRIYPDIAKFEFLTAQQLGNVCSALERTLKHRGQNQP